MDKQTKFMLALTDQFIEDKQASVANVLEAAMDETVRQLRLERYPRRLSPESRRSIVETLTSLIQVSVDNTADFMQETLATGFKSLSSKQARQELRQRLIQEYIERYGARQAAQVIRTTERQVRDMVNGGLSRGQAIDEVFRNITNRIPALADQRANTITATEAHAATQFTSQAMASRSGLRLTKTWDSVGDEHTRDFGEIGRISQFNHRIMNGVTVPVSFAFTVPVITGNVERLMFPGDPNGSAGNIIKCRCNQVYQED